MRIIFAIGILSLGLGLCGCSSSDTPKPVDPSANIPPQESNAKAKSGVNEGVRTLPKKKM